MNKINSKGFDLDSIYPTEKVDSPETPKWLENIYKSVVFNFILGFTLLVILILLFYFFSTISEEVKELYDEIFGFRLEAESFLF